MDFVSLFEDIKNINVGIIGDVMLDTYLFGNVERISPEAPVPVVTLKDKQYRIGGAGNVALNTVALQANTFIFSVIGNDDDGKSLLQLFNTNHINTDGIIISDERITTNKTRILSKNQQMIRVDAETTTNISESLEQLIFEKIKFTIINKKLDVIILEDYNKGLLTEKLINNIISLCKENNVVVTVDPKRKNFFAYTGVDIFKPNLKEVKDALNLLIDKVDKQTLLNIHNQLQEKLHHNISLITLSEHGIFYADKHTEHNLIPTHIRKIADVSGAGDTVIAVASLIYATTKNMQLAAEVANIAGGLVCEEVGTISISREKLLKECTELLSN